MKRLARAQRQLRQSREMALATRHELPAELVPTLTAAADHLLQVEQGIARVLGQGPSARERREAEG